MARYLDRRTRFVVDNNNNRMKKLGLPGRVSHQEWMDLLDLYGDNCLVCGQTPVGMDHIIPINQGGEHSVRNVQPLCKSCNSKKGGKRVVDYRIAVAADPEAAQSALGPLVAVEAWQEEIL